MKNDWITLSQKVLKLPLAWTLLAEVTPKFTCYELLLPLIFIVNTGPGLLLL